MAAPPPPPAAAAPGSPPPPAQVVGNAFVHQYYNILHQSPELVFRFYQEASRIGRPAGPAAPDMDTVTTMEAINAKIMSMDIARAEIRGVDAQESLCGGVTVLVTGHLTGKDDVCREFAQSFFLAPQEKGYYVLNDILRYVGQGEAGPALPPPAPPQEEEPQPAPEAEPAVVAPAAVLANGTVDEPAPESAPRELEVSLQPEQDAVEPASPRHEEEEPKEEVINPPSNADVPVDEETPVPEVIDEVPKNEPASIPVSAAPVPYEEPPKKSYASIVKVMKAALPAASALPYRPAPPKPEKQAPPPPAPAPAPVADAPALSPNPESSNVQEPEVDALAVYVRNLPLNATPSELEEVFKKFGTIKKDGIQVRSHKIQGFCYGFVEFEDASAVQSALSASPVMIDDRACHVEEKRTGGLRGNNRRFPAGRGAYLRSEGTRGRGNYTGGGRGYGRGEFSYRSDYGGRGGGGGRGSSRGGGDVGYQRVDPSGAGGPGARAAAK